MNRAWVDFARFLSTVQLRESSSVGHSKLHNLRHPPPSAPTFELLQTMLTSADKTVVDPLSNAANGGGI
jgi:hypothetical protein